MGHEKEQSHIVILIFIEAYTCEL